MTFSEKISIILKDNTLGIATKEDLAEKCGFSRDTIRKAIDRGTNLNAGNTRILLDTMGINRDWWEHQKGEVFNEKHTSVQNEAAIPEKPLRVTLHDAIRAVVEDGTEYVVVPKVILEGKYRLVAIEQMEKDARELEDRSNQIQALHEIIKEIATRPINIQLPKMEATK